jgi:excinuclease UvrABC nuclease subunit
MKELSDFEISEFGRPNKPGVYAIWATNRPFYDGEKHLLYIGSSVNIHSRLSNNGHPYRIALNRLNGIVYVSFIETDDYIVNESYLISKHKPILNKKWH